MKVSYKWLQKYFDKELPEPNKLSEIINLHAFEVESSEEVGDDTVFDLKVMPDRAHYALCHRGIANEIKVITNLEIKNILPTAISPTEGVRVKGVKIGNPNKCLRYMARVMENISVEDSPDWLKRDLEAIGARSINSIVDITNFVMFDVGQPLHVFDADKVKGNIVVRDAREGEKITLLDGSNIELKETDLVIADDDGPIAIAGVKGGKRAEVQKGTKNIIIESANFDHVSVRRTSNRLNLRNESSKRFENSIVPELAGGAMDMATSLITELSSGAKAGAITDVFLRETSIDPIRTTLENIEEMIGTKIKKYDFEQIVNRMGMTYSLDSNVYTLYPPPGRLDLRIPEDIADEVSRIKGYSILPRKLPPDLNNFFLPDKYFYWSETTKNILTSLGFSEILLYTLSLKGALEISYPLAKDKAFLRDSILPKMKEVLISNGNNIELLDDRAVKIFEIGKTFTSGGEKTVLALGVMLKEKKKGMSAESILEDALITVATELKIENKWKVIKNSHTAMVEIDFDGILSVLPDSKDLKTLNFVPLSKDKKFTQFSQYPFITRDIALFVPSKFKEEQVRLVIKESAVKASLYKNTSDEQVSLLVKGPNCFDRFEKEGNTSFAFRMVFQSIERTLSDNEVNQIMEIVYEAVREKGWQVR